MSDVLDILLNGTARNVQRDVPEQDYKVIRLSSELGQDVIFRLRALPYSTVAALRGDQNLDISAVLGGVVSPDFKDVRLAAKYGLLKEGEPWGAHGVTPPELVQAMLLPGEIAAISLAVQKLSGYSVTSIEEVKKN